MTTKKSKSEYLEETIPKGCTLSQREITWYRRTIGSSILLILFMVMFLSIWGQGIVGAIAGLLTGFSPGSQTVFIPQLLFTGGMFIFVLGYVINEIVSFHKGVLNNEGFTWQKRTVFGLRTRSFSLDQIKAFRTSTVTRHVKKHHTASFDKITLITQDDQVFLFEESSRSQLIAWLDDNLNDLLHSLKGTPRKNKTVSSNTSSNTSSNISSSASDEPGLSVSSFDQLVCESTSKNKSIDGCYEDRDDDNTNYDNYTDDDNNTDGDTDTDSDNDTDSDDAIPDECYPTDSPNTPLAQPVDSQWTIARDWGPKTYCHRGRFIAKDCISCAGIALFWNGIVSVFLAVLCGFMPGDTPKGLEWWFLFFFLIPFEIIGLILLKAFLDALFAPLISRRLQFGVHEITIIRSFCGIPFKSSRVLNGVNEYVIKCNSPKDFSLIFRDLDNRNLCTISRLTQEDARWLLSEYRNHNR